MKGSTFLGLLGLFAGVWLLDCAYKGRPPLATLRAMIVQPQDYRSTADAATSTDPTAFGTVDTFGSATPNTNKHAGR